MKSVITLNKIILRELTLPFTICLGSFLVVWSGLYLTGAVDSEEVINSIGSSLVNVFLIFSMIMIFDFISTKSRILITLNYSREFVAKYNLVLHLILVLVNSLILYGGATFTSIIEINGITLSETTSSVSASLFTIFVMLLLLIDYINTIICTFINYSKITGFLFLTISLLLIGYVIIQYIVVIYGFYQIHPMFVSLAVAALCLLMEIFIYNQIKEFEIKK